MKKIFTFILLLPVLLVSGQYFQRYYNVSVTPGTVLQHEIFNSGLRTIHNYNPMPDTNFLVSVGTSYRMGGGAGGVMVDRLRFVKTLNSGASVPINVGYEFLNANAQVYHSSGNGVAEIKNATGTGGFVSVGAVTSNYSAGGALAIGGSDALFARINSLGSVTSSVALDFGSTADTAWCVRRSNYQNNTFLMCGQSSDLSSGNTRCFVARLNANGVVIWAMSYFFDLTTASGPSAKCKARQLCEDAATGKIYVVGTQEDMSTSLSNVDGLIFCLSSGGGVVWSNIYHLASADYFTSVRFTNDNNLIVGGYSNFSPVGAGPMVNMLLLKARSLNGSINWQTLLRATSSTGAQFDSKGFDVLERKIKTTSGGVTFEYYIAGPSYPPSGPTQLLYRTKTGGVAINSYHYNKMVIDSLFALDVDSITSTPGIIMFSSLEKPGGISSSHILKATYQGATCTDYCVPNPPKNIFVSMQPQAIQHILFQNYNPYNLSRKKYFYKTDVICSQAKLNCSNPRALSEAITEKNEHRISVYPNPAKDMLNINIKSGTHNPVTIRLMNSTGQQMWQGKISGSGCINIRQWPRGTYFIKPDEGYSTTVIKVEKL